MVSVFAIGFIGLASSVLLSPAYLLAVSKFNTADEQLAALEKKYGNSAQEKEISGQIREINNKITLLSSGDTSLRLAPPEAIVSILGLKESTIKIFSLTYDLTARKDRVVLTGTAADRDSLSNFFETLKKDPLIDNVTLPISSYVKSTNIDFSVVIERKANPIAKK